MRVPPPRTSSKTLREMFAMITASGDSNRKLAEKIGRHHNTISRWRSGQNTPDILDVEFVFQIYGYKIQIVPANGAVDGDV